jgi:hypothetical protein
MIRVLTKLGKSYLVHIPQELVNELGWVESDFLEFEICEVCEDDGNDHKGIIVSNITKKGKNNGNQKMYM